METQMRLADRRGLLQGADLSLPQEYAVEILAALDLGERARLMALQLAAVGGPRDDAEDDEQETGPDEGSLSWQRPTQGTTDMIEQWMAEHTSGSIRARELVNGGDWT